MQAKKQKTAKSAVSDTGKRAAGPRRSAATRMGAKPPVKTPTSPTRSTN